MNEDAKKEQVLTQEVQSEEDVTLVETDTDHKEVLPPSPTEADEESPEDVTDVVDAEDESTSAPDESEPADESSVEADEESPEKATDVINAEDELTSTSEEHASSPGDEEAPGSDDEETPPPDSPTETPDFWSDDEDLQPEELLEAYDETLKSFQEGHIVKGTVVKVDQDDILVDIGYKSEGYIPISEFDVGEDGLPSIQVGDSIDVYLVHREDADGLIVLSKEIADQKLIWDEITQAYEEGRPIQATVIKRIKGGLRADIGTMRAFLPASQVDIKPAQDLDQFIGQQLEMKVIKLSRRRRNIVLSRRVLLEEELAARKAELLSTLQVGSVISGEVKNITQFGAFVDLGGVDGLLHKSDMSWGRVNHPSEKVKVGQEIEVMILQVDREGEKVSLGLKQKNPDPWMEVDERYPIGSRVKGRVVNIVDYGAFIELEEGVEGLLHVSEMSWTRRIVHPNRVFKRGDEIEAIVLDIDRNSQRISLGLRQLQENPWATINERYPVGSKIRGKVRNLTDFGAFVEVEEGIDGLIHVSDLSWAKRVVNPVEVLKENDEVEVVVLSIDADNQRISLGLKQVEPDPWIQVPEQYKVGSVVQGTIVNLTNFGAFAKLEEGVEGLIHISELADHHVNKPEEVVAVGQILDLKVISLDPIERRIGLSLKAYLNEQNRAQVDQYRDTNRRSQQQQQQQQEEERPGLLGALLQEELNQAQARRQKQQEEEEEREQEEE